MFLNRFRINYFQTEKALDGQIRFYAKEFLNGKGIDFYIRRIKTFRMVE